MPYYLGILDTNVIPPCARDLSLCLSRFRNGEIGTDDIAEAKSEVLEKIYRKLIQTFPPLNGRDAPPDEDVEDEAYWTDYSIGKGGIWMSFTWTASQEAFDMVTTLVKEHHLAMFDVETIEIYDDFYFAFLQASKDRPIVADSLTVRQMIQVLTYHKDFVYNSFGKYVLFSLTVSCILGVGLMMFGIPIELMHHSEHYLLEALGIGTGASICCLLLFLLNGFLTRKRHS